MTHPPTQGAHHPAMGGAMTDYGAAILHKDDNEVITVAQADRMIGMTREVFRLLRDLHPRDDGYLQLDTAGAYVYRFHRDDPSPHGFSQDVVVFTRVEPWELARAETQDRSYRPVTPVHYGREITP